MRSAKQTILRVLAVTAIVAAPFRAFAATSTFLTVPNQAEEALTWCGAAAGQSIAGGYPTGACTLQQFDVWSSIQAHKAEPSWDTDPAGLRDALRTLCPLPAGHSWVAFSNASAASIMYSAAFYMSSNHYPVALLLSTAPHNAFATHHEHWVTLKGIVTDKDPLTNSSVTLQYVLIYDQTPTLATQAVERFLTGAQWYAEFQAVSIPGSAYNGKFVAIIEPPTRTGTASARDFLRAGTLIRADRALAEAVKAAATTLRGVGAFGELAGLKPLQPQLVNQGRGAYYLVPFAAPNAPPTMAVLINAYSGEFLEAARFRARPMVLSNDEAVNRAAVLLPHFKRGDLKATLVRDGDSPYFPAWRITAGETELIVDDAGLVRPAQPMMRPAP